MVKLGNLIKDLSDPDWHRREAACKELGRIGTDSVVPTLIELIDDKHPPVQQAACDALGDIGDKRAVFPMLERVESYKRLRRAICRALGKIGDFRAVEPLLFHMNDESPSVCFAAFKSLGQLGDKRALDPLIEKLTHDDWHVREAVCQALGNLGDPRAVDPIINRLNDDTRVRWAASKALGMLGDIKAVEHLLPLLDDPETGIRSETVRALAKLEDMQCVVPIIAKLNDSEEEVHAATIDALVALGKDKAVLAITGDPENKIDPDFRGLDFLAAAVQSDNKNIARFVTQILNSALHVLKINPSASLCSTCFTRFEPYYYQISLTSRVTTYVCRTCLKSGGLLTDVNEVIAVLNGSFEDVYVQSPGIVRVNWLKIRKMIDIDRIEIGNTGNDDVKELISVIENDNDELRLKSRKKILCTLKENCSLDPDTVEMLKQAVGIVV